MSIKGFSVGGVVQRYDYTALDNLPQGQGVSDDLKAALLQIAQKVAYIDDQGQTYYDALYDALYPEKTLLSITANFQQGQAVIYNTDSLDTLKQYLTVTAVYDDASTETVPSSAYTLSGTLTTGTSVITVTYEGKTDAFNVVVTAAPMSFTVTNTLTGCTTSNSATSVLEDASYTAVITASSGYTLVGATVSITMGGQDITTSAYSGGIISINNVTGALVIAVSAVERVLSSITAAYTQSGTVYDTDSLDSLKADLVVTANYSDGYTQTVPADDYTLSGTLTEGTSTITVSYGGKTTTFNVTITDGALKPVPSGYTAYDWIQNTKIGGSGATNNGICLDTDLDGSVYATIDKEIDCCFSASGVSTAQVSVSSSVYGMRAGTGEANIPNSRTLFLQRRATTADPPNVPAWQVQYNGAASIWTQLVENTVYTIITKNKNVYCNGELISEGLEGESYTPANITIALFGEHRDNYYALKVYAKIRHFIVRDADGKALAAMYPAKNSSDVSGMYDVIRNRFFTARTSAWLTCGND